MTKRLTKIPPQGSLHFDGAVEFGRKDAEKSRVERLEVELATAKAEIERLAYFEHLYKAAFAATLAEKNLMAQSPSDSNEPVVELLYPGKPGQARKRG